MEVSIYDIAYFKELHNGHKIIYCIFSGREFVFRTLTRKEYNDVISITTNDEEAEDAICQATLLYPEDFNFAESPFAGISPNVAPTIIEESGFTDLTRVLDSFEESREETQSFDQQCMILVKAAMPEYTYEELEDWTWDKLMKMTARAESILNLKGYNIQLNNNQDEIEESIENEEVNRDEFVKDLRLNGVDPMDYFEEEIFTKKDYLDFPLIGGIHWDDEDVLNEIRRQMEKTT